MARSYSFARAIAGMVRSCGGFVAGMVRFCRDWCGVVPCVRRLWQVPEEQGR